MTTENRTNMVYNEIVNNKTKETSLFSTLAILIFSVLLFLSFGLTNNPIQDIVILIAAIFFHETGHLIGMKLFKYNNVKMFFIPFFGAAVSGEKSNVDGFKDCIITFMGPLPGIVLALILIIFTPYKEYAILSQIIIILLFINGFNLLPFYPLDGGRIVDAIIFHRNIYLQLIYKVFAILTMIIIAVYLQDWIFGMFALTILFSIPYSFRISKLTSILKKNKHEISNEKSNDITKDDIGLIIKSIDENYNDVNDIKELVRYVKEIWEKFNFISPGKLKSFSLFFIYLVSFIFILVSAGFYAVNAQDSKVITKKDKDGKKIQVYQTYFSGKLSSENSISNGLYHGIGKTYNIDTGKISKEGQWYKGKWHSSWKFYDEDGILNRIIIFDKGKYIESKELVDGAWVKKKFDDLSKMDKEYYLEHEKGRPEGPQDVKKDKTK